MPDVNDMALQASLAGQQADQLPRDTENHATTNTGPVVTTSNSTMTPVAPAGYEQATQDLVELDKKRDAILQQRLVNAQKLGEIQTYEAKVNADRMAAEQKAAQAIHAQQVAQQAEQVKRETQANDWFRSEQSKLAQMKPTSYWADKGIGNRILSALAIGLGTLGASMSKTPNYAKEIIDGAIAAHQHRQRESLEQQIRVVEMASKEPERVAKWAADRRAALASEEAYQIGQVKRQAETLLAAKGADKAAIQNNDLVLNLEEQRLQKEQEAKQKFIEAQKPLFGHKTEGDSTVKPHWSRTDSHGSVSIPNPSAGANNAFKSEASGKPATDVERKADGYTERMYNQAKIINSSPAMSDKGREILRNLAAREAMFKDLPKADFLAKSLGFMKTAEQQLSGNDRKVMQAMREFLAANLRLESGAAISLGEVSQGFDRFSPALGDSHDDISRKRSAMADTALVSGNESYRPTYWRDRFHGLAPKPQAATQPPEWKPGARVTNPKTGRTGVVADDGVSVIPDGP